jgi:quinol monooxygenase YgiN
MIIIEGALVAKPETVEELLALAVEHVHRSRLEPGCLAHGVARDVDNPLRLVFAERWADMDAVRTHFGVEASNEFVRRAIALADEPPVLEIFEATPAKP